MATIVKAMARTAAATTLTTLYTVPASTTAVITNIVVTNTANAVATYNLSIDGISIATTVNIAANDSVIIDMKQVLAATKTITGLASATTVNFHISGVEIV